MTFDILFDQPLAAWLYQPHGRKPPWTFPCEHHVFLNPVTFLGKQQQHCGGGRKVITWYLLSDLN